jgi:hypothetical protein
MENKTCLEPPTSHDISMTFPVFVCNYQKLSMIQVWKSFFLLVRLPFFSVG